MPAPDDAPRQNHTVSPVLLGILKESPSPACNQGGVNHPQAPQPCWLMLVPSLCQHWY